MTSAAEIHDDVTCPFCGLCCDDLKVASSPHTSSGLTLKANGCALAKKGFEASRGYANGHERSPTIAGEPVGLDVAIEMAASLLQESRQPLFGALACDVGAVKAAMQLADGIGGTVDHLHSDALFRNFMVVQNSGWITTTVAEIRNHADLIIMAGTDGVSVFPRFFERCVWTKKALFVKNPQDRRIVYLGKKLDTRPGTPASGKKPQVLPCDTDCLAEVFGALRALYNGWPLQAKKVAGVSIKSLEGLIGRIREARYPVIVWAASSLKGKHADLTVQAISNFIKDVNETQRMAGFPIGAHDNAFAASQVATWQGGFPLRTSFASGYPVHDATLHSAHYILQQGLADSLVWISVFRPEQTPPALAREVPTIVIGHPAMQLDHPVEIFIPAGVPGLDHKGSFFRADSVASLPLRALRENALPDAADVIAAIEQKLRSL